MNIHFYVYFCQKNTLEYRLYLFLQDMHELTEINNRLYWMYRCGIRQASR